MSETAPAALAAELHARVPALVEGIDAVFMRPKALSSDALSLRRPDIGLMGVEAGYSLCEAQAHLNRLQGYLLLAAQGQLPPEDEAV